LLPSEPRKATSKAALRCARAPSSALRAPSPVNGRRAFIHHLGAHSGSALLLRSGRRRRAAPDEGASAASCSCPPNPEKQRQKQLYAALTRPPPSSGHLLPYTREGLSYTT